MKSFNNLLIIFFLICPYITFNKHIKNKKLNVLFCVKKFPTKGSWFILNQMTEFIEDGHSITILTRDPGDISAIESHPDIANYNLHYKTFHNYLPKNRRSFDIILCQFSSLAPYAINFIDEYNVKGKLFIFIRGAFCHRHDKHKKLREKIFKQGDLFLGVCEFSKQQAIQLGCDPEKVSIIRSTVDCDKFTYRKRSLPVNIIKIVTVCRLTEQKGVEYAIKAVEKLLKKYPNCSYQIIGTGKLLKKLSNLIKDLHLEKQIFLEGWKDPNEIQKILDKAHIFLHPSVTQKNGGSEGIPTAIMEAMAMGLPVISTYHAGIPELINNKKSGLLAQEKNVSELTQKIIYLIEHPKIWDKIEKAGRRAVEKNHDKITENKRFIKLCKKYVFSK